MEWNKPVNQQYISCGVDKAKKLLDWKKTEIK